MSFYCTAYCYVTDFAIQTWLNPFEFRHSRSWDDFGDFGDFGSDFGSDFGEGLSDAGDTIGDGLSEAGDKLGDAFDDWFGDKRYLSL